jgi:hypothetical protein
MFSCVAKPAAVTANAPISSAVPEDASCEQTAALKRGRDKPDAVLRCSLFLKILFYSFYFAGHTWQSQGILSLLLGMPCWHSIKPHVWTGAASSGCSKIQAWPTILFKAPPSRLPLASSSWHRGTADTYRAPNFLSHTRANIRICCNRPFHEQTATLQSGHDVRATGAGCAIWCGRKRLHFSSVFGMPGSLMAVPCTPW